MLDHRALLKKYIYLVAECEGTTFIPKGDALEGFSSEELAELQALDAEAFEDA